MANPMISVYYKLIKAGNRTIDQVPANVRADVQALLDAGNIEEGGAASETIS